MQQRLNRAKQQFDKCNKCLETTMNLIISFMDSNRDAETDTVQDDAYMRILTVCHEVLTEYQNKLANSLFEWEEKYNSAPAHQPRPVAAAGQADPAPANKNYKSRSDLKPECLTAEFNPIELEAYLASVELWMVSSWNDDWINHVVPESQVTLDPSLVTKLKRKIDFNRSSWEDFKQALEDICLINHPILRRRIEILSKQAKTETLPNFITRLVNAGNNANIESGLTKDEILVLGIMTGINDPKVYAKIVEHFPTSNYTVDDLTAWADRQEMASAPLTGGKGSANTVSGGNKRCKKCNRKRACKNGNCPPPCTLCGIKNHIFEDCWGNPAAKHYKESFKIRGKTLTIVNKKQAPQAKNNVVYVDNSTDKNNTETNPLNPTAPIFAPAAPPETVSEPKENNIKNNDCSSSTHHSGAVLHLTAHRDGDVGPNMTSSQMPEEDPAIQIGTVSDEEDHQFYNWGGSVNVIKGKAGASTTVGYDFGDTPTIRGILFKKFSQKVGEVDLLPDSGATVNLMSLSLARKLHLAYDAMREDKFDVQDAQGQAMIIAGKCTLRLKLKGNDKYRTMEVLLTDHMEEEKIILGWGQLVAWGILPRCFPAPDMYEQQDEPKQCTTRDVGTDPDPEPNEVLHIKSTLKPE